MKFSKILPIIGLGIISGAAVSVGVYFIFNNFKQEDKNTIVAQPFDWKNFGNAPKYFSQKNSFKVSLATSTLYVSSGTAWSFYLDDSSSANQVKWYLLTNFHVVNNSLSFNGGVSSNDLYYEHNIRITKGFALYDSIENTNQEYRPLITSNWNNFEQPIISSNATIDVISDNAKVYNNNDDLNLFSNSSNKDGFYNLDMSLIKITLSKNTYNQHLNIFNNIANPYKMWKQNNALLTNVVNNKKTYIAGNPGSKNTLVASSINENDLAQQANYQHLVVNVGDNSYTSQALRSLYFRSIVSKYKIKNWVLSEGASGSAVYQLPENTQLPLNVSDQKDNPLYKIIPIGIYWGGMQDVNDDQSFIPAFIPFKTDRYNIYANFESFLNSKYNQ